MDHITNGKTLGDTLLRRVQEATSPIIWTRLNKQRDRETAAGVERRLHAMLYRVAYGWTVVPAAYPVDAYGEDWPPICSCRKGDRCETPGKHPVGNWGEDTIPTAPGVAQTAVNFIVERDANVAILTGRRSGGLVVADVDPRSGGTLDTLWSLGWPQDTVIEQTGGGGWHLFYHADDLPSVDAYAMGVEVKGDGKLIIASPSWHKWRRRYEWLPGHAPWEIALAPLPDSIAEDIRSRTPAPTTSRMTRTPVGDGSEPNWYYSHAETVEKATRLLNWAIRNTRLDDQQREHRNNMAYRLGFQLGSLGLSDDEVAAIGALYTEAVRDE
jgi:hypothetical protein